ncbi:hypothetical protein IHE59_06835, partial [Gardnerella vaginalis]|nr:hypothetical protein [Gardnerella vaginalis]
MELEDFRHQAKFTHDASFSTGGLNNPLEMRVTLEDGPINKKLAQSIAIQ